MSEDKTFIFNGTLRIVSCVMAGSPMVVYKIDQFVKAVFSFQRIRDEFLSSAS
jgi:hypothetical protein